MPPARACRSGVGHASAATALVVAGLAVAGGGQDANDATVRSVTSRFLQAVGSGDGNTACTQLSPQTRSQLEQTAGRECRSAVTGLKLDTGRVARAQIFVGNAIVELASGETEFLEQG